MKQAYYNECDNEYCTKVLKVMQPIKKDFNTVEPGDIFVFRTETGGHTGIITHIDIEVGCFEHLSYSRNMPYIEG